MHLIDEPIRQHRRCSLDTTEGILLEGLDLYEQLVTLSSKRIEGMRSLTLGLCSPAKRQEHHCH